MKKPKKSTTFTLDSEHFHTERIEEGPLPEHFKTTLQALQKSKECKFKVPVVEVDGFLLMPRKRLAVVAGRYQRSLPTMEEMLLGITTRRPVSRRR